MPDLVLSVEIEPTTPAQVEDKEISERVGDAGFDYINANITAANFPKQAKVDTTGFSLIPTEAGMTMDQAAASLAKKGLRPANIHELVEWRRLYGEDLERSTYIIAIGQKFRFSPKGKYRYPFVSYDQTGYFTLSLGFWDSETRGSDEFLLAFPS
jgi:hypothetical protein